MRRDGDGNGAGDSQVFRASALNRFHFGGAL
jgi:hypothetical protein